MKSTPGRDKGERRSLNRNDTLLANIAILYYKDGLTQNEIAKRLGVSRPTVVNYLRQAREQNIVDIRINGTSFSSSKLSKDLRDAYGLKDVFIASVLPGPGSNADKRARDVRRQVARVGAMAVYDLLQPGDVLGIAWGETIQWVAEEMPRGIIRNLTICQTIGSMKSPLLPAAETSSIRIAASLNADCYTLHAPAILSSKKIADALKKEPIIRTQLEKFRELTKVLFSVGNCSETTHIVQSGIASVEELHWYQAHGAVGVICGRFINAKGEHVKGEMDERMIGITPEDLKHVRCGILVAAGTDKIEAIRAAFVGGYVQYLVTDEMTGRLLVSRDG